MRKLDYLEIKIVLFKPTKKWAADIYVDNERIYCGAGHDYSRDALAEAQEQINKQKVEI